MTRTISIALLAFVGTHLPLGAQTPAPDEKQQRLAALVKEVRAQQTALAENQDKIDIKLAALAESIRLARIYSSRGGR